MVSIGVEEAAAKAVQFKRRHNLSYPVVSDPRRKVFNHFFLPFDYNLPFNLLIGRDGRIRRVDPDIDEVAKEMQRGAP